MPIPIVLSFSGGKDSAMALSALQSDPQWAVARLMTTVTREYQRTAMHGVRLNLLRAQADALGLPLDLVWLDAHGNDAAYRTAMLTQLSQYAENGIHHLACGDLYLEDVRAYREELHHQAGFTSVFPLWGRPTGPLAQSFVAEGFRAVLVCVDTQQLAPAYCGRAYDRALLAELPASVDPCGEHGEFHTFCYEGPVFRHAVPFTPGHQVLRDDRFQYIDLF